MWSDLHSHWEKPQRRGYHSGHTGAQSHQVYTDTDHSLGHKLWRMSRLDNNHTAGRCHCHQVGNGCPGDRMMTQVLIIYF